MNIEVVDYILVNLTPHSVKVESEGLDPVTIPASGQVARVSVSVQDRGHIAFAGKNIRVSSALPGATTGLPPQIRGVLFIVSAQVRMAEEEFRSDLVSPGDLKRGPDGQPISCDGLRIN